MNPKFLVGVVVLTLSWDPSLNVQAQTSSTPGATLTTPVSPSNSLINSPAVNSPSTPSTFVPGTNPSGFINYNQPSTVTGPSGFTVPSNTLPQPNSIYNNSNSNSIFNNRSQTGPNNTINPFPTYDPYTINRPPSFYNPSIVTPSSIGVPSNGLSTPSNGFGIIR